MPPQELQIIVSAVNRMGPVIENISQGIQRLIALQEQSAAAAQTNAQATAQLLAVQQQVVQAIQALGTSLQQVSAKHNEAAGAAQQHAQAERGTTAAITEEDKALREHIRLLEAMVGLRAQQVRFAEATGSSTVAVAAMKQQIDALRAVEQGYRQLASTLDSSSVEYVKLQTAALRAGTEMAQVQQKIDASIQTTINYMRKQREETERMYAAIGKQAPTVNDMLTGRQSASIAKPAVDAAKQMNAELQKQIQLLEATAALRKEEASLAATGGKQGMQAYAASLKAQRDALTSLDSGYQSMMASLSKTSPEYLKAATASARTRTEIAGLNDTIAKGAGQYEILGMSVEKLGRRVREAMVFFVAFRIFWEAWNFVTARIRDLFDLEQQLKRVQSATIFDPSGMAKLNDLTVVLTTNMMRFGTSVKETADAMYELISAGISWVETQEGLPTVLGLVKAGVSDIGTASRAVSAIYKTWGTDFQTIGDVIGTVIISTQAEIGGFVTAFQRVAATAKLSGLEFKQTAALVGILNDAMIFGGNAGRALRQGLSQIAQERDYLQKMGVTIDATKDMGEQIDMVAVQLGKLLGEGKISTAQLGELFKRLNIQGTQAIAAIAVMADKYKELMSTLESPRTKGALAEIVDIRMDNAIDQFKRLEAAITTLFAALANNRGILADTIRMLANIAQFGSQGRGAWFNVTLLQDTIVTIRNVKAEITQLSKTPMKLLSEADQDKLLAMMTELKRLTIFLNETFAKLSTAEQAQFKELVESVNAFSLVQKKAAEVFGPQAPAKVVPKDYETILKEVRAAIALLEAKADFQKTQAKLLETSGRESDMQKSLQMQRDAIIQLDAEVQKFLPQLHKGSEEWLRLATASAKNKIEIAGLNQELRQFGSQFQMSERAVVSIAGSIGLFEAKTRESNISLKEQTEQTQTFGITMMGLQKPIAVVSKELEDLGNKYDKVTTASATTAAFLEKQYQKALDATLRAIDLREKEARASGMFDADKEAALNRERIAAIQKQATWLENIIALMKERNSQDEKDLAMLELFESKFDDLKGRIIDLNATQGDFWTAFSRGAQMALSEMSTGFKETFDTAKTLMNDLQKSIDDVLFDSITKGFKNATDGLKRFGESVLRYFTNQLSKQIMVSLFSGVFTTAAAATGAPNAASGGAFAETAKAVVALGNASGQTAGVLGFFAGAVNVATNILGLFGSGIAAVWQTLSAVLSGQSLTEALSGPGGVSSILSKLSSGLSSITTAISSGIGSVFQVGVASMLPNAGTLGPAFGGAAGAFQTGMAFIADAAPWVAAAYGLYQMFTGQLTPMKGALTGAAIGTMVLPGVGTVVGAIIGTIAGFISKLFGGSPPEAYIKGNIQLKPTTVEEILATPKARAEDAVIEGHVGTMETGPFSAWLKKRHVDLGGEQGKHTLLELLQNLVITTIQSAVQGLTQLESRLPSERLAGLLSSKLTAILAEGFEITRFDWDNTDPKKVLKQFNEYVAGLPGQILQTLSTKIFGDIDLKALGVDDAGKGFGLLLNAIILTSEVMNRAKGRTEEFTGSLEEFASASVEMVNRFKKDEETFEETLTRISEGFGQLFQFIDQLTIEIASSTGDIGAAFALFTDAYKRMEANIEAAADALTVAVESLASPDEIVTAAQAVKAALEEEAKLLQTLKQQLDALSQATAKGVGFLIDLILKIERLQGPAPDLPPRPSMADMYPGYIEPPAAPGSRWPELVIAESFAAAFRYITDISGRISVFSGLLRYAGETFSRFSEAVPALGSAFNTILGQIHALSNPQQALTSLQELATALEQGFAGAVQNVQAYFAQLRQQEQDAAAARIEALNAERQGIEDAFSARREALQTEVQLAQDWLQTLESVKRMQTDLFNLLAPTHPLTSLNDVRGQLHAAFAAFQGSPSPDAAARVQELAQQALQLAQQTPGFDLPSQAFQSLAAEINGMLSAIAAVAESQPTQEQLQQQMLELDQEQAAALANIDAQIANTNAALRDTLAALSAEEQSQIAMLQEGLLAGLSLIRDEVDLRVSELAKQQEAAADALAKILGDKSLDQFMAEKQVEMTTLLTSIQDILRSYLGNLLAGVGVAVPAMAEGGYVPARPGGTLVRLGEGGRGEWVVPEGRAGGLGTTEIVFSPTINVTADSTTNGRRVAQDMIPVLLEAVKMGPLRKEIQNAAQGR